MHRFALVLFVAACASGAPPEDTSANIPSELTLETPPDRIDVDTLSGEIHLVVHDEPTVEIEPLVSNPDDSWGYTEEAGVLRLFSLCPNGTEGCSTGFVVLAPIDQAYALSSTSGKVKLPAIYAGAATVSTVSATVEGLDLGPSTLDIATESGFVELAYDDFPASLVVHTVSSDIELEVPRGAYSLVVTTNGVVTITDVQQGSGPSIVLESTSGAITVRGYDPAR